MEEYESWNRDGQCFKWRPVAHRARCGAHCAGGGYEDGERDVHIPPFGSCPRCGAVDSEVAQTIERSDGSERVVFVRYVVGSSGFRIDYEKSAGDSWKTVARYPASDPESLAKAVEQAENYVPWLKERSV